ncbi:MAG: DNA polymerase, partial [Planctomycetota bacterium]
LRVLARHGIELRGLDGDSMIASWVLDPARDGHGLDALTRSQLGEEKIPTGEVIDLAAGQTMDQVPVATVARYACEDAQCTWRLVQKLEQELATAGLDRVYREQELPMVACLARLEQRGMHVDGAILTEKQGHLEHYLDQVLADIRGLAGKAFNPASPKQVAELLFEKLGLPVIRKTKSGPSTDASVLQALRYHHEIPDLLLQFRSLSKLLGTYLTTLPDFINPTTGRIHSCFKQTGTETGRLSSEQPNLQNIPKRTDLGREIRAAFTASPGHVLLAADYSQIELRVLAHFSGERTLQRAFADGTDIHRYVAAAVHGIDEAAITPEQRNAAKAVNFGLIYGQSAFGLAQQLGISRTAAQGFIDDYFAHFPGVPAFREAVVERARVRGYVETIAGRRRYVPALASSNHNERKMGERTALNSTIQGSAADLIKQAMLRCEDRLPAGAQLVVQIHDELIVEAPIGCADAAAQALHEAMTGAWELDVPLVADVRQGPDWLSVG